MSSSEQSSQVRLFRVEASDTRVRIGDRVTVNTVLGSDVETGRPVRADCRGRVSSVHLLGADHALVVVVSLTSDSVVLTVDASQFGLHPGDRVEPDTVVGRDQRSGATVTAGVEGHVASVHFSGAEHALTVVIAVADHSRRHNSGRARRTS